MVGSQSVGDKAGREAGAGLGRPWAENVDLIL